MSIILVAGGTGFIGSQVVKKLVERGHQVTVMSRNPAQSRNLLPAGIEVRPGDVTDLAALKKAMSGVDVVISAVQFPNHPVENARRGHTYMEVDGYGTTRQVEAAKANGVKHFIYLSGAGTRAGQGYPWFKAKLMAEKAVKESGIPFTIVQPSWIYGPKDRSLNKFVTFARFLPFIPVIGDGTTRVSPVFVQDVAEVIARCVDDQVAKNKTYELGGPQELSMDQIIQTMLKAMGKSRPLVHHPAWFMKIVTVPMSLLPTPPLSPSAVDFVLMEEPVDNTAVLRDFDIQLTPLAEGLRYLS